MNKVILMGRLTRDPDVRYSAGSGEQQAIARYTLAVDRRVRRDNNDPNAQTADFISCVAFSRSAQFAEQYLRKGIKIAVTGRIQTGSYTNRDGVKVYTTEVVVEDQEFAESKQASENYQRSDSSRPAPSYGMPASAAAPIPAPETTDGGFINIPEGLDEELPFK